MKAQLAMVILALGSAAAGCANGSNGLADSVADARGDAGAFAGGDGGVSVATEGGEDATPANDDACVAIEAGSGCYASACSIAPRSLHENRDRLVSDLAKRKCTDSCTLWGALNQAERYIFLMDTAYLGGSASRIYPPSHSNTETALDHVTALYSINGPKAGQGTDGSGRGGGDYNRIYLGFDSLATCVMRDFAAANPSHTPGFNEWVASDDIAGAHAPFNQREMILWYKAFTDPESNGPQFHHWAKDSDFNQAGLDQRLGVCGVTDRSVTELTIAFDFYHNSDPLGDYAGRGGYGWQIVDQHVDVDADWGYAPSSCPATPPVNSDPFGGGTFGGMGPSQAGGACTVVKLGPC